MANTSPITGISHENGQWALHGPYAELLAAVARKAEESLQEHLRDDDVLVGTVQEFREPEEESISPCTLDTEFRKVEDPLSPIETPGVVHTMVVKGDHAGPLAPTQSIPTGTP